MTLREPQTPKHLSVIYSPYSVTETPLDCPQALALCHYLDTHRDHLSLVDKAVLEIGAGTGLVSVVAALLGKGFMFNFFWHLHSRVQVSIKTRNTEGMQGMMSKQKEEETQGTHLGHTLSKKCKKVQKKR